MTRRSFISTMAKVIAGLISITSFGGKTRAAYRSKVVDIRHSGVWKEEGLDRDILAKMLDEGMMELTGRKSPKEAWKDFISKDDTVGIKINPSGGPRLCTHRELVDLVIERITSLGVPPEHIIIWDRFERDLVEAGYEINVTGSGVRCYATDGRGPGYDEKVYYEPEEDSPPRRENGEVRSLFSRIITQEVTRVINLPVLKHHPITGVSLSLKNITFGSVNNTARFHPIEFLCDPAIPEIFSKSVLRGKAVLHIIDGLIATYEGGPGFKEEYSWRHSGLILSTDPVAADKVGLEIIEGKRKEKGLDPISIYARHISTAGRMGLGNSSMSDITLKEIKLDEEAKG
ncbi:DUF362 domain-containing protein [Candidatus Poribacteria bacterium]|nr:DUF362 domain-containing protein [Candidatus Poribacteria bacterium]